MRSNLKPLEALALCGALLVFFVVILSLILETFPKTPLWWWITSFVLTVIGEMMVAVGMLGTEDQKDQVKQLNS